MKTRNTHQGVDLGVGDVVGFFLSDLQQKH